ncbi:hypothetical protein HMI55_004842, partial [Coelomomyces lativittatus]
MKSSLLQHRFPIPTKKNTKTGSSPTKKWDTKVVVNNHNDSPPPSLGLKWKEKVLNDVSSGLDLNSDSIHSNVLNEMLHDGHKRQPSPTSSSNFKSNPKVLLETVEVEEESLDPLDAFMEQVSEELRTTQTHSSTHHHLSPSSSSSSSSSTLGSSPSSPSSHWTSSTSMSKPERLDLQKDDIDAFSSYSFNDSLHPTTSSSSSSLTNTLSESYFHLDPLDVQGSEYIDSDEEVYRVAKHIERKLAEKGQLDLSESDEKRIIEPLKPIDHSQIQYIQIEKNVYKEHPDIQALTPDQAHDIRKKG